jgi:hypothetical protein
MAISDDLVFTLPSYDFILKINSKCKLFPSEYGLESSFSPLIFPWFYNASGTYSISDYGNNKLSPLMLLASTILFISVMLPVSTTLYYSYRQQYIVTPNAVCQHHSIHIGNNTLSPLMVHASTILSISPPHSVRRNSDLYLLDIIVTK